MITLITGAPGTGKSAALVDLLTQLGRDRTIFQNGIPDLKVNHESLDDVTTWPQSVPDGSIIVIDEVQRFWRPRAPGAKVPPDISALETHRHRGIDFYIVTQSPRLVDTNVRALVGRHVHLRDLGVLGRMWYEWPECAEQAATAWKNAPLKKRYRLPKRVFSQYKSASEHIKPVRSFPAVLLVLVAAIGITGVLAFEVYGTISSKINPSPALASSPSPASSPVAQAQSHLVHLPNTAYDPTAFVPYIGSVPESAPAFDSLRHIKVMPQVIGGACMGERCKCYTQQGTDAGLSDVDCRKWISNPPFNPYADPVRQTRMAQPSVPSAPQQNPSVSVAGAGPGL